MENNQKIHEFLLGLGYKVSSAPDEATIYDHEDGGHVIVHEATEDPLLKVLSRSTLDPVTGDTTPEQATELLTSILIKRDAR